MLATLPSATTTIQSISEWANPWLTEFWPWFLYIPLGLFMVGFAINFIKNAFLDLKITRFENKYDQARDEALWKIEAGKKNEKDWWLWKKSKGYK